MSMRSFRLFTGDPHVLPPLPSGQLLFVSIPALEGSPSFLDMTVRELEALKARLYTDLGSAGVVSVGANAYEFTIRAEGPDADALLAIAEAALRALPFYTTATVLRRYGGPGAPEKHSKL